MERAVDTNQMVRGSLFLKGGLPTNARLRAQTLFQSDFIWRNL